MRTQNTEGKLFSHMHELLSTTQLAAGSNHSLPGLSRGSISTYQPNEQDFPSTYWESRELRCALTSGNLQSERKI